MRWFKIDDVVFVAAHTETGTPTFFQLNRVTLAKPTSGSTGTTIYFGADMYVKIEEPFEEYQALMEELSPLKGVMRWPRRVEGE